MEKINNFLQRLCPKILVKGALKTFELPLLVSTV